MGAGSVTGGVWARGRLGGRLFGGRRLVPRRRGFGAGVSTTGASTTVEPASIGVTTGTGATTGGGGAASDDAGAFSDGSGACSVTGVTGASGALDASVNAP